MSYIALARQWRPRRFDELVGQSHITKALNNALTQQRLHHAYLFTGTRGVGKTSVARILAKALNCETGITATPCLTCDNCQAIEQGKSVDLIEVDGASRTRVEDTRALLDNIAYTPTQARFKIYLIDEVHMLSQHSFNALLKTLEEPPDHVKFLLATTDPQKIPVTVLSRCLQFNLKPLDESTLLTQLAHILKQEKQPFDEQAITLIARAARGSMRDALSLLDQAILSSSETVSTDTVQQMLGHAKQPFALHCLQALAAQDANALIEISQRITEQGASYAYVLDELIRHLHELTLYQQLQAPIPLSTSPKELFTLSEQFPKEDLQLFYQIALKGLHELELAPAVQIGFDMTLLRMLTFRPAPHAKTPPLAYEQTAKPSATTPSQTHEKTAKSTVKAPPVKSPEKPAVKAKAAPKAEAPVNPSALDWRDLLPRLNLTGLSSSAAEHADILEQHGQRLILGVDKPFLSLFTKNVISRLESALSQHLNATMTIKIQENTGDTKSSTPKGPQQQKNRAKKALEDDPVFNEIQNTFSGTLLENSVVSLEEK